MQMQQVMTNICCVDLSLSPFAVWVAAVSLRYCSPWRHVSIIVYLILSFSSPRFNTRRTDRRYNCLCLIGLGTRSYYFVDTDKALIQIFQYWNSRRNSRRRIQKSQREFASHTKVFKRRHTDLHNGERLLWSLVTFPSFRFFQHMCLVMENLWTKYQVRLSLDHEENTIFLSAAVCVHHAAIFLALFSSK